MKGVTYKHTFSGNWDDIIVKDKNNAEVFFRGVYVFFDEDVYFRGSEGEEEILITLDMSPLVLEGSANNEGFPYQVKGEGFLKLLTIN